MKPEKSPAGKREHHLPNLPQTSCIMQLPLLVSKKPDCQSSSKNMLPNKNKKNGCYFSSVHFRCTKKIEDIRETTIHHRGTVSPVWNTSKSSVQSSEAIRDEICFLISFLKVWTAVIYLSFWKHNEKSHVTSVFFVVISWIPSGSMKLGSLWIRRHTLHHSLPHLMAAGSCDFLGIKHSIFHAKHVILSKSPHGTKMLKTTNAANVNCLH